MPEITVNNVQYIYPDGNRAVDSVSFEAEAGQSIGLVGANGAGKSTLLLMLLGVLTPAAGEIWIRGTRLTRATAAAIRRDVGLVFQDSDDQLFMNTVYEDVAFGPLNAGLTQAQAGEAAREALEMTGIAHLKDRAPYKLSGGEKRLAAIASVLSMQPKLIVMDEPSASLDPKARRGLIGLCRRLPQLKLIATHDLDMVWDVCERTVILQNGRVAADGDTRAILSDAALLDECGLELPLCLHQ